MYEDEDKPGTIHYVKSTNNYVSTSQFFIR